MLKTIRLRWLLTLAALLAIALTTLALYIADEIDGGAGESNSLLLTGLAASLAATLLALLLTARLAQLTARVTKAARSITDGDFSSRVAPSSTSDDDLSGAFNRMASGLEGLVDSAREERRRLTAALDASVDAVVALDAQGSVAYANRAAPELLHRPMDELLGSAFGLLLPNDEVLAALRASRDQGSRATHVIERSANEWLQVSVAPILGGGGWSALVVIRDLSEVKRVERVRREFIANVSHELRTPLAGVKAVLETLATGALQDEAVARDFVSRADMEIDRLVQLVEELLELSRIESGEVPMARETIDLGSVVLAAVQRQKHRSERHGLELTIEAADDLPSVIGDAERLERVVVNLVSNAIKFTPEGGSIRVSCAAANDSVAVYVTDTGVGIDPDNVTRVFERFYKADRSRQESGTGLGLAVVKHTVEAHGGSFGVKSELGSGSTFWFRIPVAPVSDNS
ncbi:MAG: PAS domain S-box protein [Chloroflexi bacterium]|nr:PAS domain S-box protein [Chloroflexota bacterium]